MELQKIETLLERYLEGETSITEEQALRDYFAGGQVAPQFEMYTSLFGYFESAKKEQYSGSFNPITTKTAITYINTIAGTILSVTVAIFLIPPMMTIPTRIAIIKPNNHPFP